jgi:Ser/Thr protein kinase RdoA (MazF antagonist)
MIEPLRYIVRHWGMNPEFMETLRHHPNVTKVKGEGKNFYLKRRKYSSVENQMEEHYLTSYLLSNRMKVECPLLTSSRRPYVKEGNQLYSLYEALEGTPLKNDSITSLTNAGAYLSTLHLFLKKYRCHNEVKGWEIEKHVREWVDKLDSTTIGKRGQRILSRMKRSRTSFESLPSQLVHSDYNPGNILIKEGEVSGIIDFERIRTAPRITDIGYFLAGILKVVPEGRRDHSIKWIKSFMKGYERYGHLSFEEQRLLPAVVNLFLLQHAFLFFHHGYSEAASACIFFIDDLTESSHFQLIFQNEK